MTDRKSAKMRKQQRRMVVSANQPVISASDVLSWTELSFGIAFSRVLGIGPVRSQSCSSPFSMKTSRQLGRPALQHSLKPDSTKKQRSKLYQTTSLHHTPARTYNVSNRSAVYVSLHGRAETYPPLLRKIEYAPSAL